MRNCQRIAIFLLNMARNTNDTDIACEKKKSSMYIFGDYSVAVKALLVIVNTHILWFLHKLVIFVP